VAEYLSEEEQLVQLKSWWNRYGWWLVAALVIGLGGYFLMQYLESQRAEKSAAASAVFEAYQQAPDDNAKAASLRQLDGEFAGTAYHVMSLLARAQEASDAEDIEAAVGFYQQAADGPEVDHLSDVARLRLARSLQQLGRSDAAFAALGSVAGEGYRSLVAELKGDILQAQGKSQEAREAYAAAVAAQGENPQTLLKMKLANIVANDVAAQESNSAETMESEATVDDTSQTETTDLVESQIEAVDTIDVQGVPVQGLDVQNLDVENLDVQNVDVQDIDVQNIDVQNIEAQDIEARIEDSLSDERIEQVLDIVDENVTQELENN